MSELDCHALLRLVLASICIAVEQNASAGDNAAIAMFMQIYADAMWTQPIEQRLQTLSDWSLAATRKRSAAFVRDILYPIDKDKSSSTAAIQPSLDTSQEAKVQQSNSRGSSTSLRNRSNSNAPTQFQLTQIAEDVLEARWDDRGNPLPLRRNVLGKPFAPLNDSLQFVKHSRVTSATHIYRQVKRAMRTEAIEREKRRIQALNDTAMRRQKYEAIAAQPSDNVVSPEDALEAKLDRLLLEKGDDNTPSNALGADRDKGDNSGGDTIDADDSDNQDYEITV